MVMGWISITAFFFLIWWTVLFAALPFGLRTQHEEKNVTFGTVPSAPGRRHMPKALLLTTLIAAVITVIVVYAVNYLGLGFDDLPQIIPAYE
jgi:predicted secreted protein